MSLFFTASLYKSNITNIHATQLTGYISGAMFIGIIYQHYLHAKKLNEYTADYANTEIDKQYIEIMELYFNGYSWDKISLQLKLSITGKSVQRLLDKEWKRRKFKNREQFAHFLGQKCIITELDKNVIT